MTSLPTGSPPEPASAAPGQALPPVHSADSPDEPPPSDADSVKRGIAARAASPGASMARNNRRDDARRRLTDHGVTFEDETTVNGDVFTGGQTNIHHHHNATPGHELGTHLLSETDIEEARHAFVGSDDLPDLIAAAPRNWVTIFRAAPGSGTSATALRVLVDSGSAPIYALAPDTDLRRIRGNQLATGAGYLLRELGPARAATLTAYELRRLDDELGAVGARLVITTSSDTHFPDGQVNDYVLDLVARPDLTAVLVSQFNWRLKGYPRGTSERLLARPDTKELLREVLAPTAPLSTAAELAQLLAEAAGDPDSMIDTVRARREIRVDKAFGSWFESLDGLRARCFVIALAVMDGLPYTAVADAASALYTEFANAPKQDKPPTVAADPFGMSLSSRLNHLRARLARVAFGTRYGTTTTDVVEFIEPGYPALVLHRVWREYDQARGTVLEWLRKLGGHPDDEVRVRAATAVGSLTADSFEYLRGALLVPWADSRRAQQREAAAIALETPVVDAALCGPVLELINEWSVDPDRPRRQATAARALGTSLGLLSPDRTMDALERLADQDNFDVVEAVCQSVAELVAADTARMAPIVLPRIVSWATSRTIARRVTGQLAFLFIAADLVEKGTPVGADDSPGLWPTLLALTDDDAPRRQQIAGLWNTALSSPATGEVARQVLGEWAELMETDARARTAFIRLFQSTEITARTQGLVRRLAQGWIGTGEITAPKTGAAVVAALS